MLNFSLGIQSLLDTCSLARVRLVLTSRRFVEISHLEEVIEKMSEKFQILYLEDIRTEISLLAKMTGFLSAHFPELAYRRIHRLTKP